MELNNEEKNKELIIKAIEEAHTDAAFREKLLSDPLEAINSLTDQKFDFESGKKIVFVDQEDAAPANTDTVFYINIAEQNNIEDLQLSEEQLEAIAGGKSITDIIIPFDLPIIILPIGPGPIDPSLELGINSGSEK